MIVAISTTDYTSPPPPTHTQTPSFVKVTSAGGGGALLKKEHSALPSSYPASRYFTMVRVEQCHTGVILHINIFKMEILDSKLR